VCACLGAIVKIHNKRHRSIDDGHHWTLFYTIDVCNFFLRRVRRLSSFRDSQQMIWSFLSLSLRVSFFSLIQLRICSTPRICLLSRGISAIR
jgi:hypothetical protein